MDKIAVYYNAGTYRVHAASCRDAAREVGSADRYPAGSTVQEIAESEFSDFMNDDPDYYTPKTVRADFEASANILPCAAGLIGQD